MDRKFKDGAVVVLKSDQAHRLYMTVVGLAVTSPDFGLIANEGESFYLCRWIDVANNKFSKDVFREDELTLIS